MGFSRGQKGIGSISKRFTDEQLNEQLRCFVDQLENFPGSSYFASITFILGNLFFNICAGNKSVRQREPCHKSCVLDENIYIDIFSSFINTLTGISLYCISLLAVDSAVLSIFKKLRIFFSRAQLEKVQGMRKRYDEVIQT